MFASSARVWKVIPAQLQTGRWVVQDLRSRRICLPIAPIQNIHTDLRYVCQQCTCLKDDPSTTLLFPSEHDLHTHTEQLRKESSDKQICVFVLCALQGSTFRFMFSHLELTHDHVFQERMLCFLSPSGDLGIGLVLDNPIPPHPPFGPTVEILFKLNQIF